MRKILASIVTSLLVATSIATPAHAVADRIDLYFDAPFVQGSYITGTSPSVLRENFNSLGTGTCPANIGVGTVSGDCRIDPVAGHGGATPDVANSTPTVGGVGSKFATTLGDDNSEMFIEFADPAKYIGLWWSAGNTPNNITFYMGDQEIVTLTTEEVFATLAPTPNASTWANLNATGEKLTAIDGTTQYPKAQFYGNPRGYASTSPTSASTLTSYFPFIYLHLFAQGDFQFTKIKISGYGFEFDNMVVSTENQTPDQRLVLVDSVSGEDGFNFDEDASLTCPIVVPFMANNTSSTLSSGHEVSLTSSAMRDGTHMDGDGSYWVNSATFETYGTLEISPAATKFGFEAFHNSDSALVHEIITWVAKNADGEVIDSSYVIEQRNTSEIEIFSFSEPISTLEISYVPTSGPYGSVLKTYVYADASFCAPADITVTYDAGAGTVSPASAGFTDGDDPLILPTPTRDGYVFGGWYDSSDNLIGGAGDEYTPSVDITLSAEWFVECDSVITTNGRENIVTFNYTGDCAWAAPADISEVEYLVVGGGGGGGGGSARGFDCDVYDGVNLLRRGGGGGGGAGGEVIEGTLSVAAGDVFEVSIGNGGTAGPGGACPASGIGKPGTAGSAGTASQFGEIVANGGAGGAGASSSGSGASGGSNDLYTGGSQPLTATDCSATATVGCFAGAGGAGAGAAGGSISESAPISQSGGAGGAGYLSEITGTYFAGGGGGGNRHPGSNPTATRAGGAGGIGGGGAGNAEGNGASATVGTGGGGGGGRGNGNNQAIQSNAGAGGAGGSGTVVLRYFTPLDGFTVSFDTRGGTPNIDPIEWETGDNSIVLPSLSLAGYTLVGWFLPNGNLVGDPGNTFIPTSDVTLKAVWRLTPTPVTPVQPPAEIKPPTVNVLVNNGNTAEIKVSDPAGIPVETKITAINKDVVVVLENNKIVIKDPTFVGNLIVTVTATNSAGASVSKDVHMTVNPKSPDEITAFFTSAWNNLRLNTMISTRTKIVWTEVAGAVAYQIVLDGKVVGTSLKNEFSFAQILNPKNRVKVVAIGPDETKSPAQKVRLSKDAQQLARINFESGSAELTPAAEAVLEKLIKKIIKQDLRVIQLSGYTDNQGSSDGALELAKARAMAVRAFLRAELAGEEVWIKQSWFADSNFVGDNQTFYGQALNRRVDIYLGN